MEVIQKDYRSLFLALSETLVFAPMIILFELNDKVSKIDEKISVIENKDKTN